MTQTPILQPGQLESAAGEIPELLLPPAHLFADRSRRFHQLAEGSSLSDYLLFLGRLAGWQHTELDHHPEILVPDTHLLDRCREHTMPPLASAGWPRQPRWKEAVHRAIDVVAQEIPLKGQQALSLLLKADKGWLEIQADAFLQGNMAQLDLAAAPFIGAALQVQWTYLAQHLQPNQVGRSERLDFCPVCGSPPVASIIHTAGSTRGLRYLHCVLCGSAWHVVRAKCSRCANTKGIEYFELEGANREVRAEACPECCCYLKIFSQEKDARVDPVADDIATLTLDLLMSEKNYAKSSVNLFMIPV
ncbi:MAG: formate dehydrogenase accessory protein FdhE [Desulfobulbus sp.]|nr:formate dehydrogenase accessory protein FdhE [Desulfobulbus sp.]